MKKYAPHQRDMCLFQGFKEHNFSLHRRHILFSVYNMSSGSVCVCLTVLTNNVAVGQFS